MDPDRLEAIRAVVDRVGAYQDGAPEGTVAQELSSGAQEAGVDLSQADVDKLAAAIEARRPGDGDIDVQQVIDG